MRAWLRRSAEHGVGNWQIQVRQSNGLRAVEIEVNEVPGTRAKDDREIAVASEIGEVELVALPRRSAREF
jgi:hypothetical protein